MRAEKKVPWQRAQPPEMLYHRLAAVHHAAKADAYASARMHEKAAGHRARARRHLRARFGAPTSDMATWLAEELTDPFTLDVFDDPVVISTGHTFERAAITEHRQRQAVARCPNTRRLFTGTYVPNELIRQLVRWFDGIGERTELQNAEELATKLSNPETSELLLYPVVDRARGGNTFEREALAASSASPDPLVPNRLVRSIVERFVSAYARHPDDDGGDWARVRAACAAYSERKRTTKTAPEYLDSDYDPDRVLQGGGQGCRCHGRGCSYCTISEELSEEEAEQYILERARREGFHEFDNPANAGFVRDEMLPRAGAWRRPQLDEVYDAWSRHGGF